MRTAFTGHNLAHDRCRAGAARRGARSSTSSARRRFPPTTETERHIRERNARGLFADMRFTMAQPEVSCHPETLLAGARTVVSAAYCYYAPEPGARTGRGTARALHLARRLRRAARAARRARPPARRRVPRARRRQPARRPRGSRARGRRLLRQEHDADHPPSRLVGRARDARDDVESRRRRRSSSTADRARSASTRVRPVRSTSRARSTRRSASRTGRRRRQRSPRSIAPSSARRSTAATSARTSARGTAASRSAARTTRCPPAPSPRASLGLARGRRRVAEAALRPAVRPEQRRAYLRRNALVALGNTGRARRPSACASPSSASDDELLREQAEWAVARIEERHAG